MEIKILRKVHLYRVILQSKVSATQWETQVI